MRETGKWNIVFSFTDAYESIVLVYRASQLSKDILPTPLGKYVCANDGPGLCERAVSVLNASRKRRR